MFPFLQHHIFKVARTGSWRLFSSAAHPKFHASASLGPFLWGSIFLVSASIAFRPTVHLDAESLPDATTTDFRTDPATSIEFPTTLIIASKNPLPKFSLVGLGVRTVSFLGIKVYSVGFYADLDNPKLKISKSATPEEKIEHIVRNTTCVIRIIPTRSTSYTHLRDGFMRALLARMKTAHTRGIITAEEETDAQSHLRILKSIFPNAPFTKHTPLDILVTAPPRDPARQRALVIRNMGSVENNWVATEFLLAYFEGAGLSPALKNSVVERLDSFGE
ncbi:hypothetical protein PILCRDRAFT_817535 [Piloderma croceum F 1598]|uniref:Chalcone isomerase domain-containing protein n=1 Tax=Piloderma croceum (strain F 1598) TaxID=765440 RepID=A0A0C3G074_PILCF|nr:hypothetical protein PILCRDRAFT_817535 [Piloderma croceum F 1598]